VNLVFAALKPVSVEEPADDGDGMVWRYRKRHRPAGKITVHRSGVATPAVQRPSWLDRDAGAEPPSVRLISPALAYDEAVPVRAVTPRPCRARQGLGARRAGAPLAAVTADIPQATRAKPLGATLPDRPLAFPRERERMVDRFGGCSMIRASRRCFGRGVAPRSQSLDA